MLRRFQTMLSGAPRDSGRSIAAGAVGSILLKVLSIALGFAVSVLLVRLMLPEDYGLYVYALTIVQLAAIPMLMGAPTLIIREVARLNLAEDWGRIRGLLVRAGQFMVGYSLLLTLLGALALTLLAGRLSEKELATYALSLTLFAVLGLFHTGGAVVKGLRHVVLGQVPETVLRPVTIILAALAAYGMGSAATLEPQVAMGVYILATLAALAMVAVLLRRLLPGPVRGARPVFDEQGNWWASLVPFTVMAGANVISTNADIVMLGLLKDYETVALYRVASRGAVLVSLLLYATNIAIAPYLSRLKAATDMDRLQRLLSLSALAVFLATLPIFLSLLIFGREILEVVFGEAYGVARTTLAILCVGQFVNVVLGPVGLALNMTGNERKTAFTAILAAILNVVLNYPLILLYGIEGAAIATVTSLSIMNLLQIWFLRTKTGLVTFPMPPRWGVALYKKARRP